MAKSRRAKSAPFVRLDQWMMRTAAWRDLDPVARALYVELRARFNGTNNGSIAFGVRDAAEALGLNKNAAKRGFDSLIEHGFIEVSSDSTFDQKRLAREWLLTEEKDDRTGTPPSKKFARWSKEIQNIVPVEGRIVPIQGHEFATSTKHSAHSPATGTMGGIPGKLQSLQRDTYRSTIPPSKRVAS